MNIVIPNADFSSVAIGKVDMNVTKIGDYHVYSDNAGKLYYIGSQYSSIFDVEGCTQIYIKASGKYASSAVASRPHCIFYSEYPGTDLTDASEANAFNAYRISAEIDTEATLGDVYDFEGVVSVPTGSKCVLLQYLSNSNYDKVCIKES